MRSRREDVSFQRRNLLRYCISIVIVVLLFQCWPMLLVIRFLLGLAGLIVGYGVGNLLEAGAIRRYRCPRCQTSIGMRRSDLGKSPKVLLPCGRCNIEWDLGLDNSQGEDGGGAGDSFIDIGSGTDGHGGGHGHGH
jgi:hypothetical protein